jgi:phenylpyruvate tautomerase PptA (4-oxalocrotonate tautomerase family)
MPRWNLYLLEGALSRQQKDELATNVTKLYTAHGIPAFWVNVFFNEYSAEGGGFYSGGKSAHDSIFFHIDHAARGFESEEQRKDFIAAVNAIVRPIFGDQSFKWEFNIYEHPAVNWRINGMIPPVHNPEVLREWTEKDAPIPYDDAVRA